MTSIHEIEINGDTATCSTWNVFNTIRLYGDLNGVKLSDERKFDVEAGLGNHIEQSATASIRSNITLRNTVQTYNEDD
jgi:hypothetical protein